jgi:hypothetical protein
MSEVKDLVAIPKDTVLDVFSKEDGLRTYLDRIRDEANSLVPDTSTRKGRDAIASMAFKVAKAKTALDDMGKTLVADLKELPKKIDASRKLMRDELDTLKDSVRAPLTEWEKAEEARVQAHRGAIADMQSCVLLAGAMEAERIQGVLAEVEGVALGEHWEEFEAEAGRVKDEVLTKLRASLAARQKYEAEQAELAALRAKDAAREKQDREERIAREAAEATQRKADEEAQKERDAAIKRQKDLDDAAAKREQALKLQAEQARTAKLEAEQRAQRATDEADKKAKEAVAAEQKRVADAKAAELREAKRREADRQHRGAINRLALDALIDGGLTEETGMLVIQLIAQHRIPAVTIAY